MLDVEEEVHDVSVLDDIFLALDSELSCGSDGTFAAQGDIVFIFDHFCPYEALLEVGMDYTSCLWSLVSLVDRPCAALVAACCEEGLETE